MLRTVLTQLNGARAVVEPSPLERTPLDTEPPCAVDAEVVENATNRSIPVGDPLPGFGAFLDGRQDSRVVAWVGSHIPLVIGTVSAGIQRREGRRLRSWGETVVERRMYAPLALLDDVVSLRAACHPLPLVDTLGEEDDTSSPLHPALLQERARQAVLRDRERAEERVGAAWCRAGIAPLFVDGGLPGEEMSESPLAVGVVKSHRTLYSDGEGIDAALNLSRGERTRVMRIVPQFRRAVHSWYLRLRESAGHDGLWGLVRIEVAESEDPTARADLVSRWVLAERVPLAAPDARWDRLAYGVRAVEQALGSVASPALVP